MFLKEWYTKQEVSEITNLHTSILQRYCNSGQVKTKKEKQGVRLSYLIHKDSLKKLVVSRFLDKVFFISVIKTAISLPNIQNKYDDNDKINELLFDLTPDKLYDFYENKEDLFFDCFDVKDQTHRASENREIHENIIRQYLELNEGVTPFF